MSALNVTERRTIMLTSVQDRRFFYENINSLFGSFREIVELSWSEQKEELKVNAEERFDLRV